VVYVSLTEKGRVTIRKVQAQRKKIIEGIFSNLSFKERSDYISILRKIKNRLSGGA
jgi:DNA-binding MarR family transcriptional regulator